MPASVLDHKFHLRMPTGKDVGYLLLAFSIVAIVFFVSHHASYQLNWSQWQHKLALWPQDLILVGGILAVYLLFTFLPNFPQMVISILLIITTVINSALNNQFIAKTGSIDFYLLMAAILIITFMLHNTPANKIKSLQQQLKQKNNTLERYEQEINDLQEAYAESSAQAEETRQEMVEILLQRLNKELNLTTTERISIYYDQGETLAILARYSQNPEQKKFNRPHFSKENGVLGKAWHSAEHIERTLPAHQNNPSAYLEQMKKTYHYHKNDVDKMKMKSCRYYARHIDDVGKAIGILLVESTNLAFFDHTTEVHIKKVTGDYLDYFSKVIREQKAINAKEQTMPSPRQAESPTSIINALQGNNAAQG